MKLFLAVLVAMVGSLVAKDAYAIAACGNNRGVAPKEGTELPQRAQILVFDTDELPADGYVVRIAGKKVPVQVEDVRSRPFNLRILKIDSDATGELRLYQQWTDPTSKKRQEHALARYTVKKKLKLADKVSGTPGRFLRDIRHSTVKEKYDALAIDLGSEAHAIKATVKLRRDAQATWQTLEVPVPGGDWLDKRPVVRVGSLGCQANYAPALLEAGVDIEVTLTMVDGSTRKVEMPARVQLAPPPPTPTPPSPPAAPARP